MNYIVTLGKGLEVLQDGKVKLRIETAINVLAAYVLYKKGIGNKIIFSGGFTKGKDKASEAKAMFDYLRSYDSSFKQEDVILEEVSIDTAGNAFEVGKLLDRNSNVILLTTSYHLIRSRRIFRNFAVKVSGFYASEKVLKQESPKFDSVLREYSLKRKLWEILWESGCLALVSTIDPKGRLLRQITSRRRV